MGEGPLISIIVPVYNVEPYLARCLDSLIGQTLESIEIICVDDGSTDGSSDILAAYSRQDGRIKVKRQINKGVSQARNVALELARGDYLVFVDPDDWLEPQACQTAISILQGDLELDYLCWNSYFRYDNSEGKKPLTDEIDTLKAIYDVKTRGKIEATVQVKLNTAANVCHKVLKRELIDKYQITFPQAVVGEDGGFWHKYVGGAKFGYYLDEKLYNYYRGRPESCTRDMETKVYPPLNWLLVFQDVYDHYKFYNLLDLEQHYLAKIFINMYLSDLALAQDRPAVRHQASQMAIKFNLPNQPDNIIKYLRKGRDHERASYSLAEKIFSVKNRDEGKIFALCGLEVKVSRKGKRVKH